MLLFSSCEEDPILTPPFTEFESDGITIAEKDKQAEAVQNFGVRIFQEAVRADSDKTSFCLLSVSTRPPIDL